MAIDTDINSEPDFNSYSSEQLAELQKSALGESIRETSLNSEFALFAFVFILIIIGVGSLIFILTKNKK